MSEQLYKVTLSTKKVVYLREPLIADTEQAAAIAGKGNADNQLLAGTKLQKEMLKLLMVHIESPEGVRKTPTLQEKEMLDKLVTVSEYGQLIKVVNKLTGPSGEEGNEPLIDFVSGGDK